MTAYGWLFGDQPGPHFLDDTDPPVLMIESQAVLRRRPFHRQKAQLVLSARRHRAAEFGDRCRDAGRGRLSAWGRSGRPRPLGRH